MAQWKDITTYSRGDTDRNPHCWQVKIGKFKVTILNNHRDYNGIYVMHLDPHLIDTRPLSVAFSLEDAKQQALDVARGIFEEALREIGNE